MVLNGDASVPFPRSEPLVVVCVAGCTSICVPDVSLIMVCSVSSGLSQHVYTIVCTMREIRTLSLRRQFPTLRRRRKRPNSRDQCQQGTPVRKFGWDLNTVELSVGVMSKYDNWTYTPQSFR